MNITALNDFVCPIDGLSLVKVNTSLRCEGGHVFDLAREGYCNLLLVQQKASRDPGDNKEMVAARSRFLDAGHFAPIAERVFQAVHSIIVQSKGKTLWRLVDAGCGDGYYLDQLRARAVLSGYPATLELAGCDISKWAMKKAAKRSAQIGWAVAGNKQLSFAPGSIDIILSMFGFPDWKSFNAVQSNNGYVILVEPAADHLLELRKLIYPTVNSNASPSLDAATQNGYVLEHEEPLKFSITLENPSAINDLLMMTPHGFRISEEARENLAALKCLTVSVDVGFRILKKR